MGERPELLGPPVPDEDHGTTTAEKPLLVLPRRVGGRGEKLEEPRGLDDRRDEYFAILELSQEQRERAGGAHKERESHEGHGHEGHAHHEGEHHAEKRQPESHSAARLDKMEAELRELRREIERLKAENEELRGKR